MTGRYLSKSGERQVVKTYAVADVKQEWKVEAEQEGLSLSRYIHNLIQEARALRKQGRLKLGDRRRVEELQQELDELQTELENRNQIRSDPNNGSAVIQPKTLEDLVTEEYKPLDHLLRQLVESDAFRSRLRTELKSELYQLANDGNGRRGSAGLDSVCTG